MKKIIFFGTPDHSAQVLQQLHKNHNIEVVAVVTNPDKPVGRKKIITGSPVKIFAENNNIPVFQPEKFSQEDIQNLEKFSADFFIIVAYGSLISQAIIDIPKDGTFNLHFSLLPQYRGATPIQSALLAGEKISGISIFKLVEAMDAGEIFLQKKIFLQEKGYKKNHLECWNEMLALGILGLQDLCTHFENFSGTPQLEKNATFCGRFVKADGEIFPSQETAEEIMQKYRGYFIWPGIFSIDTNKKRIMWKEIQKISQEEHTTLLENFPYQSPGKFFLFQKKAFLQTKEGILKIITAQKEGKKPCAGNTLGEIIL